jgi:trehalose-phosphatase
MKSSGDLAAAVFDLDGVVTLTARVHFAAWKALFDDFLLSREGRSFRPFDEADYRAHVDGRPRDEGVGAFLASRGIALERGEPSDPPERETACGLGNRQNALFHEIVDRDGVEVDRAAVTLVRDLRAAAVPVAVASTSKNCGRILARAGLADLFDATVDGIERARLGLREKPEPDVLREALRRLGVDDAAHALVVEDAGAGVAAGRAAGFGLVVGVDRGGNRVALRERGAHWIVERMDELSLEGIRGFLAAADSFRPNAIFAWGEVRARLAGGRAAIFLDYDGTLTPIVARPELAILSDEMRARLREVARVWPTCIVSGRGLDDVRRLVGVDSLVYAGSHGFEIRGPNGLAFDVDPEIASAVARAAGALREPIAAIPGALVEDKRFSVAVHYRQVAPERVGEVESIVDRVLDGLPELRKTHGKMVFELRPARAWDKGKALLWLLESLGLDDPATIPLYVGDDVTDEDAFAAIAECGVGVLVTDLPKPTKARLSLQDVEEVGELLRRLAALGREKRA